MWGTQKAGLWFMACQHGLKQSVAERLHKDR